MNNLKLYDCIIIGGGIFGLHAASFLSSKGLKIALLEKNKTLFKRASKINQSRIHRGYHYPRSIETAKKVAYYYYRFREDFHFALLNPFKQYYAFAEEKSKISIDDYINFCKKIDIPLKEVRSTLLFQKNKVVATFEVEESCFNYLKIKNKFIEKFRKNNRVDIYYKTIPTSYKITNSKYVLALNGRTIKLSAPVVINATYSNTNIVNNFFGFSNYELKYELCELLLCNITSQLHQIGLTVIDGPFFSFMPFADGKISTLSSVQHTPINTRYFKPQNNFKSINKYSKRQQVENLARRYLNSNISFKYRASLFEIKPILLSSEKDDARPTIVTIHSEKPYFVSILAGKISTIYDIEKKIGDILLK